jgi:hypothetical protein
LYRASKVPVNSASETRGIASRQKDASKTVIKDAEQ